MAPQFMSPGTKQTTPEFISSPIMFFLLDENHNVVRASGLKEWAERMDWDNHHVGLDCVGTATVSTVFIGITRSFPFTPVGCAPLVFESHVFGSPLDGVERRYATWGDAAAGHAELVRLIADLAKQEHQMDQGKVKFVLLKGERVPVSKEAMDEFGLVHGQNINDEIFVAILQFEIASCDATIAIAKAIASQGQK